MRQRHPLHLGALGAATVLPPPEPAGAAASGPRCKSIAAYGADPQEVRHGVETNNHLKTTYTMVFYQRNKNCSMEQLVTKKVEIKLFNLKFEFEIILCSVIN